MFLFLLFYFIGNLVLQRYILITEVILSEDDDTPLSGGPENYVTFLTYVATALAFGRMAALAFLGSEVIKVLGW